MTTGIMDFMIASGRMTAMAAIPVPDFAVPYAAPMAPKTLNSIITLQIECIEQHKYHNRSPWTFSHNHKKIIKIMIYDDFY